MTWSNKKSERGIMLKQFQLLFIIQFSFLLNFIAMNNTSAQPLQSVQHVDLKKYEGKWFEIASFPQRFQNGCHCTTATYTISEKGYVIVENRCNKGSVTGK